MFGRGTFHAGSQRNQPVQQFFLDRLVLLHLAGDGDQLLLGLVQEGRQLLGRGQATQGHQAVGFQLQQAQRDPAGAFGTGDLWCQHQDALEAIRSDLEVAQTPGMALPQLRTKQAHRLLGIAMHGGKPVTGALHALLRLLRFQLVVQHPEIDGGQRLARDAGQPAPDFRIDAGWLRVQPGTAAGRQRQQQRIAREFGVALPLQHLAGLAGRGGRQAHAGKAAGQIGQRQAGLARQRLQMGQLLLAAAIGSVQHRHIQHACRQRDQRHRARVHLVVYDTAQGIIRGWAQHVHGSSRS